MLYMNIGLKTYKGNVLNITVCKNSDNLYNYSFETNSQREQSCK